MKLSTNFVKDYVDIDVDLHTLAEDMTKVGNEYDSAQPLINATNLVIGEVIECTMHPDSDHLHVCKVNIGDRVIQIVCGAPNVRKGLKVIVALPGAELPEKTIKKGMIRGQESNGMLCSIAELGIESKFLKPEDKDGIHELPNDAPVGKDPIEYMQMNDEVIDFDLTANRGDLLSILGMAYEIGAIYDKKVKDVDLTHGHIDKNVNDDFKLKIDTDNCTMFLVKEVKNVTIKESPTFIKNRLIASGIRPINNVVDISNYVMLELGQPLHFYDYDKLLKSKILFSFIGFAVSFIIYIIILKLYYKKEFIFDYMYIFILIINIVSVLSANLKYFLLEKMFVKKDEEYNKKKNILIILGMAFTYTIALVVLYLSFLGFINDVQNNVSEGNEETIIRIVKANTSKNTFLFNGSIDSINSNDNITNILIKEINSYDKYAEIERVLSFPAGVVIRTGSIGSRVYTYDNNILENGMSVSNIIIEGVMFESPKKEIIVGKELANYLDLKVGDALSLIAKASRGWLETAYFYVAGIYDLKDKNYDIIGDSEAMNSFIYLKEGDKSPYNESIIVFSENKNIYSSLNESSVINDYGLELLKPDVKNNVSIKNIIILFIIILAFSLSLLSSSVVSIFYRRLRKFIDSLNIKNILYTSFIISLLISIIISMLIIYFFMLFSFKFLLFTICVVLLSFILSLLISNYNDNI